ncbi:gp53-like domain-containing protein [Escherichia coli]|uniref:gp53-like domain-containing protein n=1 Tax=Escherichia coli TaxID=562 RepID=UPI003D9C8672
MWVTSKTKFRIWRRLPVHFHQRVFKKLPSGLIIQWGIVSGASNYTVTYPVTFPNRSLALLAVPHTTSVAGISAMGIANCSDISKSQFYIIVGGISQGEIVKYERSCFWVAIGV